MLKNWWHFLNFVQKSASVKMCFNIVNLKYNKLTSFCSLFWLDIDIFAEQIIEKQKII